MIWFGQNDSGAWELLKQAGKNIDLTIKHGVQLWVYDCINQWLTIFWKCGCISPRVFEYGRLWKKHFRQTQMVIETVGMMARQSFPVLGTVRIWNRLKLASFCPEVGSHIWVWLRIKLALSTAKNMGTWCQYGEVKQFIPLVLSAWMCIPTWMIIHSTPVGHTWSYYVEEQQPAIRSINNREVDIHME